jgi:hypothetical protein
VRGRVSLPLLRVWFSTANQDCAGAWERAGTNILSQRLDLSYVSFTHFRETRNRQGVHVATSYLLHITKGTSTLEVEVSFVVPPPPAYSRSLSKRLGFSPFEPVGRREANW